MAEQELRFRDNPENPQLRSWGEALIAFLKDPQASLLLKVLLGLGPVTLVNDVIPVVGLIDAPYMVVWVFVLIITYFKVSAYRVIPAKH